MRAAHTQWGKTPLHYACLYGHEAVAGALVAAGANLEATDEVRATNHECHTHMRPSL